MLRGTSTNAGLPTARHSTLHFNPHIQKVSNRYYVTEEEPNRVPRVAAELGHLASETWRAEGKAGALKALRGPNSFTVHLVPERRKLN